MGLSPLSDLAILIRNNSSCPYFPPAIFHPDWLQVLQSRIILFGLPAATVARAYLARVTDTATGQTIDPRTGAGQ